MTNELTVQYVRFEAQTSKRVYFFDVRELSCEPREYRVTIPNEAFASHRARFQDGAAICSVRMHRELDGCTAHPAENNFAITDAEIDDYRVKHAPKQYTGFHPPKPFAHSE